MTLVRGKPRRAGPKGRTAQAGTQEKVWLEGKSKGLRAASGAEVSDKYRYLPDKGAALVDLSFSFPRGLQAGACPPRSRKRQALSAVRVARCGGSKV